MIGITLFPRFTCEIVDETVEWEVSEVGRWDNPQQRIKVCSHARHCGQWANCPYVYGQKPLPTEAHVSVIG